MRRHVILVLVALLATAALVSAQEPEPTPDSGREQESPPSATMHMVTGAFRPLTLEPVEDPAGPLAITVSALDSCSLAPPLDINEGGITNVRDFQSFNDPVLSCMWGEPRSDRGFRTAWYEFTPSFNGLVTLSTQGSTYDTVLAVYTGECGDLNQVACNDDSNYFTSRYDMHVQAGKKYYVEVADWHFGASGPLTLHLSALLQPSETEWTVTSLGSDTASFRSRHAVVAYGNKLYIIAGQTAVDENPIRTPIVYEYNTTNGRISEVTPMPGPDGLGYSNTTAALVNDKIFMPAGFIGVDGDYDSTHWFWQIDAPQWETAPINNLWADGPAIYSQATTYTFGDSKGAGYFLSGGLTGRFPDPDTTNGWEARDELYFYSDSQNWWYRFDDMPNGRFGHVAALQTIGGKIHLCVAGGLGKNGDGLRETLDSTACYDINKPSQPKWSEGFAPLTYGRYFASSAVDPRGNWFVFGGYDGDGNPVPFTERYDARNNRWVPMLAPYNVGIANPKDPQVFTSPPRAWPSGAFVGDNLWIVGGETSIGGDPGSRQVLNIVQWAEFIFPRQSTSTDYYLPQVYSDYPDDINDTFQTARQIPFGGSVKDRFFTAFDYVNIYDFVVPVSQNVNIKLVHLADGNSLDIVVYTDNKSWVAEGRKPGTANENIKQWLPAGRYFVVVERDWPPLGVDPTSAQYRLSVGPG